MRTNLCYTINIFVSQLPFLLMFPLMKRQVRCFLYKRLANSNISIVSVKSFALKNIIVVHKWSLGRKTANVKREGARE
jgi:hypothetical protein